MSFSVNDHLIDKKSIWSFSQWSFWHELNVKSVKMIILLIEDENYYERVEIEDLTLINSQWTLARSSCND
jgi:hypothetical protein